jgi:hypothetical protein
VDVPTPPPELVAASRRHLTERYAAGEDRLRWQAGKRFLPDAAAIRLVTDAAMAGLADALDLGAALVLVQASRLRLDGLEYEIFQGAHAAGLRREALAIILGQPGAAAAGTRQRPREARPGRAGAGPGRELPGRAEAAAQAAARAGQRAGQAAGRAAEAARRRKQLTERGPAADGSAGADGSPAGHAERAAARAREARLLADEAADRVRVGLIHAAAALDRYAARCADLSAGADADAAAVLSRQAREHRQAAARYREMAARYSGPGSR